jgi:hypothetical protein
MKKLSIYLLVGTLLSVPSIAAAGCPNLPKSADYSIFFQMKSESSSSSNGATPVRERKSHSTAEGALAYSQTLKTLILCDGTSWVALDREP